MAELLIDVLAKECPLHNMLWERYGGQDYAGSESVLMRTG